MYRSFDPEALVTSALVAKPKQRSPRAGQIRHDHRFGMAIVVATLVPSWALIGAAIGLI